eukprot:scaffold20007_cov102-Isochrysis_galbana.AAC.1
MSLVHARPSESFVVALIVPSRPELVDIGQRLGCPDLTPDRLCADPRVEAEVLRQVRLPVAGEGEG